ncbi:hypothetical protein AB0F73_02385 [Micromonospora purpureochromogenes]|uniref:hypothetical protein n=1 Tax=Micromonospora purpureochromogenes TaxID=47872 RepID=UPI0033CC6B3D
MADADAWLIRKLIVAARQGGDAHPDLGKCIRDALGVSHPNAVTQRFRRLVKQAGLPPIRLRDLRHGAGADAADPTRVLIDGEGREGRDAILNSVRKLIELGYLVDEKT